MFNWKKYETLFPVVYFCRCRSLRWVSHFSISYANVLCKFLYIHISLSGFTHNLGRLSHLLYCIIHILGVYCKAFKLYVGVLWWHNDLSRGLLLLQTDSYLVAAFLLPSLRSFSCECLLNLFQKLYTSYRHIFISILWICEAR